MKRMPLSRLFALPLALTLLLSPAAQALTPNQARELLQDYYIDEVPEDVLDQNTIQAMLEALGDPYTTYFSPEEYGAFTGSMSDTDTVGVGIYSLVTADGPLIQRVYENTPAADAGLQPGDLVTAVDGRSTAGQDAGTVAAWLKGDPGTRVELSYRRDGAEYTAVLTRRAITVPATYTELWDGHIGYIDCDTFGGGRGPLRQRHGGHRRRS
ncbi:MAG: S41 family peptidase [Flavonifractor plautii]